jgi:hypothetical protein
VQGFWTALVAVAGTLGGATMTYIFGRHAAAEAESFARREQVRQDRLAAYLSFAEALSAFRWACYERWHREHDDPRGDAAKTAAVEYYRMLSAAENALLRVRSSERFNEIDLLFFDTRTSPVNRSRTNSAASAALHGGAPVRALATLDEIGTPDRIDDWIRAQVLAGAKIHGLRARGVPHRGPAGADAQGDRRGPRW